MKRLLFLVLLLLPAVCCRGQEDRPWELYMERRGLMEDSEAALWEQAYDELAELAVHKLDLNRCTRADLERLPFLSAQQVMDIMAYRDRAGRIESLAELRMITSLERHEADLLMRLVTIVAENRRDSVPSLKRLFHGGRHELTGTLKVPFYKRRGDDSVYLGYPYKHWLRYTYSAGPHLKAGIVASQDAGEPFFAGRNKAGYDFYTYYLLLKNMGRLRTLAVGRYRLRFGMGLVMNNSFGMGKLHALSVLGRQSTGIYAHSSRTEALYMQGAAAQVALSRHVDLTAFVSRRSVDATLNADSATVATLLTSGYHRTRSEMARRRNTVQQVAGGHAGYARDGYHVGMTAFYTDFNRTLQPDQSRSFRRWYPVGSRFWNASIDYGYVSRRLNVSGETAVGNCSAVATINSVSYMLSSRLTLTALQRYYPYQYYSLFSETFADGGSANNESGVYVGGEWAVVRGWHVTFYTDYAYFAWPKYQASASSHSWDQLVQVNHERGPWDMLVRYRWRRRERNKAGGGALVGRHEHRGRVSVGHRGSRWSNRGQIDLVCNKAEETRWGYMASAHIAWQREKMSVHGMLGYFHTAGYDERVYLYEPGVAYSFSFPSFYGHGVRLALRVKADIGARCRVTGHLGSSRYFDRNRIGSGWQEIEGRQMTDAELQVKIKW